MPDEHPIDAHAREMPATAPQAFDFRKHGHAMVDWIADYLEGIERLPVQPAVEPGWVRAQLPRSPPDAGEPWERIAADVDRVIVLKRRVIFDGPPGDLAATGVSLGVHAEDLPIWLEELS